MPKFSVGTDIVEVKRFQKLMLNKKFVQRVFTPEEIRYCQDKKNAAQHYAVRFAAKEAVWKSLSSLPKTQGIGHLEISVSRALGGQPFVKLSDRLKRYEKSIVLTLSHSKEYAIAVAFYAR